MPHQERLSPIEAMAHPYFQPVSAAYRAEQGNAAEAAAAALPNVVS